MKTFHSHRLSGLYAITDSLLLPEQTLFTAVESALIGGAQVIQYRDKLSDQTQKKHNALQLRALCKQYQRLFIINDDVELAAQVNADGVHLGLSDTNLHEARITLGKGAIIGATCHGSLQHAETAVSCGADYLAFGRFFPSKTKPNAPAADIKLIQQAKSAFHLPVVAIGGIDHENAHIAINQGADMIAVVHSVFSSHNIKEAAAGFQQLFNGTAQLPSS